MQISREELELVAREINDSIYGHDRERKRKILEAAKEQVDSAVKFALQKALSIHSVSPTARKAFVELLKEQKDAINLLLVGENTKQKAAEMLKPIFGYKGGEFIAAFQDAFKKLQAEIQLDMKKGNAS